MPDFSLMLIVAVAVGVFLYSQMQKTISRVDGDEFSEFGAKPQENGEKYAKFCDAIDEEILHLKYLVKSNLLKNRDQRDEVLENLSILSKEIVFLQGAKNERNFEEKLVQFLGKIEYVIERYYVDAEGLKEGMRENLERKFRQI